MNNSTSEIDSIINVLVEDLREVEDGAVTSTYELLKNTGCIYDLKFKDSKEGSRYLSRIDKSLRTAARKAKIRLEDTYKDTKTPKEGEAKGLPYNIPFKVRNKNAGIKCPYCGSKDTAYIYYGLPSDDPELKKRVAEGKVIIGGCNVSSTNPTRYCNHCRKSFGTMPLIKANSKYTGENYMYSVSEISFHYDSGVSGVTDIDITQTVKGAEVSVRHVPGGLRTEFYITQAKWMDIMSALYEKMYLHEWKHSYNNPHVTGSGDSWKLVIKLTDNRHRTYSGKNTYPPYWNDLMAIMRPFIKMSIQ
jgi:hypothetical protein